MICNEGPHNGAYLRQKKYTHSTVFILHLKCRIIPFKQPKSPVSAAQSAQAQNKICFIMHIWNSSVCYRLLAGETPSASLIKTTLIRANMQVSDLLFINFFFFLAGLNSVVGYFIFVQVTIKKWIKVCYFISWNEVKCMCVGGDGDGVGGRVH